MRWPRRFTQPVCTWPYTPDQRDRAVPLEGAPRSDVGAPLPVVLASEQRLILIYLLRETPAEWDGTWTRIVSAETEDNPITVVEFQHPYVHILGPPNDGAFEGHPLSERGLERYGTFVVEQSSWIRALERMNSVHEHHSRERFWKRTHYIFAFHDSTFECVADSWSVTTHRGTLREVASAVIPRLL